MVFSLSVPIPSSFAEELTYDEKLEFAFKIDQISSHMVSALDNIIQNEYGLAKMHLVHPAAEHSDIVDFLSIDSECFKTLPLVLIMLQYTEPGFDRQDINQRFSYVFQVLNDCTAFVVGTEMDASLNFNIDLIDNLLEKSVSEYELSTNLEGMGRLMEYQDAIGLVIRAHMLIQSTEIFDATFSSEINSNFQELFLAYQNNESFDNITILTNKIRDETRNLNNSIALRHSPVDYDLITPTVYLKGLNYSNNLILLELRGENFATNQKIIIEYLSPLKEKIETISGSTTSDGVFHFPLEFTDDTFDKSIMFSIDTGDEILHEFLALS